MPYKLLVSFALIFFGVTVFPASTSAQDCNSLSYTELMMRLKDAGLPMAALQKAHIDIEELRKQANFTECGADNASSETSIIQSSRPVDVDTSVNISIIFFDFPSQSSRDEILQERVKGDAYAKDNPELDVYYYLDPNSTAAFRVEREIGRDVI